MELSKKFTSISPSPTLAIDAKFKQMKADGMNVVGFGAGEPDFDTPQHIKDAAIKAINDGLTKYTPASGILPLKNAVCEKLKKDNNLEYAPSQIVISNGAKHSLMNVFGAILYTRTHAVTQYNILNPIAAMPNTNVGIFICIIA